MTTKEFDLHQELNAIIKKVNKLPVGGALHWVWAWDIVLNILENMDTTDFVLYATEDEIWEAFVKEADLQGFSIEYGNEALYENIEEWIIDNKFILNYEEALCESCEINPKRTVESKWCESCRTEMKG